MSTKDATLEPNQIVTPYLLYEDVEAALRFLSSAFGFTEREVETIRDTDGRVIHSAMEIGTASILMGYPGGDYKNPTRLGGVTQNVYVYVSDIDQHFKNASEAGAVIVSELEDTFYGDRRYGVSDLEGHLWYFAMKLRDVPAEEWKPSEEDLGGHR